MKLIDADAVKELIRSGVSVDTYADQDYVCELVDEIPTIDAVEVVRCKDCMWNDGKGHCKLRYGSLGVFDDVSCDDYCSYGVKGADDE